MIAHWNEIATVIAIMSSVMTGLGFLFKSSIVSYFNKKAENLAQKEDIEEITRKVESVKIEFTYETEKLRSELNKFTTLQLSHRNEERNAIIQFYHRFSQWKYALLEIIPNTYHRNNIDELWVQIKSLEKHFAETNVNLSAIDLLVTDQEIFTKANALIVEIIQVKAWIDKRLRALMWELEKHERNFNLFMQFKDADKETALALATEERKIIENIKELNDEYYKNRNAQFQKLHSLSAEFTFAAKDHLLK